MNGNGNGNGGTPSVQPVRYVPRKLKVQQQAQQSSYQPPQQQQPVHAPKGVDEKVAKLMRPYESKQKRKAREEQQQQQQQHQVPTAVFRQIGGSPLASADQDNPMKKIQSFIKPYQRKSSQPPEVKSQPQVQVVPDAVSFFNIVPSSEGV